MTTRTLDTPSLWSSLDHYAQLVRSLLPRSAGMALFDTRGELRWSSETSTGSDLHDIVSTVLSVARIEKNDAGSLRTFENNTPAYVFCIRNEDSELIAVLALACEDARSASAQEHRPFSFMQSLLRPVLECLRRDLLARLTIDHLQSAVAALDQDLERVLSTSGAYNGSTDHVNDLQALLHSAVEQLKCVTVALIIPDKNLVQMRSAQEKGIDSQFLARTHRHLIAMAQMRREPVIINQLAPQSALGVVPYRILSCPVRHVSGRSMGVLAFFRCESAPEFVTRDARMADALARNATTLIENTYDSLSGLYTRRAFEQRLRANLAPQGGKTSWSALYIDADQLHAINDSFGMHVGDGVIAQLGELIRANLAPGACAARISGDRFAILLPTSTEDAATFAEVLRAGAEQLGHRHGQAGLHVSVSIGVAPLDAGNGELSHTLAAAETACKAAKDRGRNRVEVYSVKDASIVRRFTDIHIAGRVRAAIAANRLQLYAQPILPFTTGEHARPHFELLLRMIDESGETVGPDRFLSAANRYQLMPSIDRWVVEQALRMLEPHATCLATQPVVFAINFSGQSLHDDEFGEVLLQHLQQSALNPSLFCFELTENATIAHIKRAEVLMRRLRKLGCGVALDDFGTGLSSLSWLRQLPVTMLKIDGSFVRDILKDPRSDSMVRAIAQLARSMSMQTVAEYVETEEIRTRLATLGVDYGQGFAIGRPVPLDEVLADLPLLAAASPVACEVDELYTDLKVANA